MSKQPKLAKEICKLLAKKHLLSATDLHGQLKTAGHEYNKTSIYRAIDKLSSSGLICRQVFGTETKYELRENHHDHVVCDHCCKIESVECTSDKKKVPGFQVDHHHTTIYGTCDDCVKS